MECERCKGCKYISKAKLNDYELSFCHPNKNNIFGYANVYKKKGSFVPGAIWQISKKHEKKLDLYEQYPNTYKKSFFYYKKQKVMFYIMKTCAFRKPSKRYVNLIKAGYKNCNLDLNYLKKRLSYYKIK